MDLADCLGNGSENDKRTLSSYKTLKSLTNSGKITKKMRTANCCFMDRNRDFGLIQVMMNRETK
jgi:hypothetical protein